LESFHFYFISVCFISLVTFTSHSESFLMPYPFLLQFSDLFFFPFLVFRFFLLVITGDEGVAMFEGGHME
jgi:hypothetical protein